MKFLVTWRVHEEKRHDVLKMFSEMTKEDDENQLGGVEMIGRWHDIIGFTGAAIMETDDQAALGKFLLKWNGAIDFLETTPVFDDEETREIGRSFDG